MICVSRGPIWVDEKKRLMYVAVGIMFLLGLFAIVSLITNGGPLQTVWGENADAGATATNMINQIVHVVCIIVMIVGGLFCLVGIVKFAIAHAENQGPEQQKATLMLATGIILIILPMILDNIDFAGVASDAISQNVE